MSCGHSRETLIDAAVAGALDGADREALRLALESCPDCRALYDTAARAIAAFEGRPGLLPEAAVARTRAALLDAVAPAEAEVIPLRRRHLPWREIAVGLAIAAAVILLLRIEQPPTPEPAEPELTARGMGRSIEGFRLFCIDASSGEPQVRATAGAGDRGARCAVTDRLQFTYSADPRGDRFLNLFAIAPDGEVIWYWPREEAVPVQPNVDQPLPGSYDLRVRHAPGRYRVFAVFSDRPLNRAEARGALSGGAHRVFSTHLELR